MENPLEKSPRSPVALSEALVQQLQYIVRLGREPLSDPTRKLMLELVREANNVFPSRESKDVLGNELSNYVKRLLEKLPFRTLNSPDGYRHVPHERVEAWLKQILVFAATGLRHSEVKSGSPETIEERIRVAIGLASFNSQGRGATEFHDLHAVAGVLIDANAAIKELEDSLAECAANFDVLAQRKGSAVELEQFARHAAAKARGEYIAAEDFAPGGRFASVHQLKLERKARAEEGITSLYKEES
jgi:hypothetical protein